MLVVVLLNGIEHVRLALAVIAYEAIQFGREREVGLGDVLVIKDGYSLQNHLRVT